MKVQRLTNFNLFYRSILVEWMTAALIQNKNIPKKVIHPVILSKRYGTKKVDSLVFV